VISTHPTIPQPLREARSRSLMQVLEALVHTPEFVCKRVCRGQ
jgi:hypothetical protein